MKGNPEEAVKIMLILLFFQCGLGHMMGLMYTIWKIWVNNILAKIEAEPKDTKTFGLKSLRLGKTLETGFVLTVEPGIYMIPGIN